MALFACCKAINRHPVTFKGHLSRASRKYGLLLIVALICFIVYTLSLETGYPYADIQLLQPVLLARTKAQEDNKTAHGDNQRYCEIYDISVPYQGIHFECVKSRTKPSTAICIYELWRDMFISHDLKETGTWEWHILKELQEVLDRDPSLGLFDIGANLGFYSLIAAKMGHKVVAVEPFLGHLYRFHKAIQIEQLQSRIVVLRNAVADIRMKATIVANGDNQGDTQIIMHSSPCMGSCPPNVNTIYLNDLLEFANFTRAVIKIDSQGFEHRAFQHAEFLLDKIDVSYIFMEWLMLRDFYVSSNHTSTDKYIVEGMMLTLFSKNFRPYSLNYNGGGPLDPSMWHSWPHDIVWRKMPSNQEYRKLIRNHFLHWPVQ